MIEAVLEKIDNMLKYLDGHPIELPSRYFNKTACYTRVYIITNIELNLNNSALYILNNS